MQLIRNARFIALSTVITVVLLFIHDGAMAKNVVTKIAFGSCSHQDKPLSILQTIAQENPDAMLWLGDNIYGDTENIDVLNAKYAKLGSNPNFISLAASTPFHAIWDDHDFGQNDGGKEFAFKDQAAKAFMDFWKVPANDPRRKQNNGIYHSVMIEAENGRLVHVIFPDLRYNRDPTNSVGRVSYILSRQPKDMGPYSKDASGEMSMLGSAQWAWLEAELAKPADIKIIASSLQVLADHTGWEAWKNYPYDINRLFENVRKHQLNELLLISGDTHWAEISKQNIDGIELLEVTSSGLSEEWKVPSPNEHRISQTYYQNNYGLIEIAWQQDSAIVEVGFKDVNGKYVASEQLKILF
jgi:alkaline phosphatase D